MSKLIDMLGNIAAGAISLGILFGVIYFTVTHNAALAVGVGGLFLFLSYLIGRLVRELWSDIFE
jgi:hypothetical protein